MPSNSIITGKMQLAIKNLILNELKINFTRWLRCADIIIVKHGLNTRHI